MVIYMKNRLLTLAYETMKENNIEDCNTVEATKFVAKEMSDILKGQDILLYGHRGKIMSVASSGLNILLYVQDHKGRIMQYRNFNDIKLI